MQTNFIFCYYCYDDKLENLYSFGDKQKCHSICKVCFPIIMIDMIISKGIDKNFFNIQNIIFNCPVCKKNELSFNENDIKNQILFTSKNEFSKSNEKFEKIKSLNLDIFKKEPNSAPINYKDKKLMKSSLNKINQFDENIIDYNGNMKSKNCLFHKNIRINFYCIDCNMAICKECNDSNHKNHFINKFDENFVKNNLKKKEIFLQNTNDLKNNLNKLFDDISKVLIEENELNFQKLDKILNECINILVQVKNNINQKMDSKNENKNKIQLIKQSLSSIFNLSTDYPINLFYKLCNLSLKINTYIEYQTFVLSTSLYSQDLSSFSSQMKIIAQNLKENPFFIEDGNFQLTNSKFFELELFKTDLLQNFTEKIKKSDFDIENKNMNFKYFNQNQLVIIERKKLSVDQILMAYGILNLNFLNKKEGDIEIYNFTTKCIETTLSAHKSSINCISKADNKYLYSCAEDLRIFNINDFSTELIIKNNNIKDEIRSCVIFNDYFNEISNDNDEYLIVFSFDNDVDPLEMCSLKKKGELISEYNNYERKICICTTYFYSNKNEITYLILGFSGDSIKLLGLKNMIVLCHLKRDHNFDPRSIIMNDELGEEKIYFVDLKNNLVCKYNLNLINRKKQKLVIIENNELIAENKLYSNNNSNESPCDILFWNEKHLLLVTFNYLMILDSKNLEIVKRVEKSNNYNTNFCNAKKFKIKIEEHDTQEYFAVYSINKFCLEDKKIKVYHCI